MKKLEKKEKNKKENINKDKNVKGNKRKHLTLKERRKIEN
jgi:hypothetical protein